MKLEELVEHFINYPSYLETGAPKLAKKFNVELELINQAKQQVRDILKQDIMKEIKQESISLKDFAKMIGIDMDKDPDYPELDNQDLEDTDLQWVNNIPDSIIESVNKQLEEVEKESEQWEVKQKWIKNSNESRLLVKKQTEETDYRKEFKLFLDKYNPKPQLTFKPKFDKYSSALMVYMSDKHIGAKTKENSSFENEWNKEKFLFRMSELAKEIIRLNELYHFDTIVLFDLGDSIDGLNGTTIRGGHSLPQNMSNREVYETFMSVHLDFFYTLVQYCECNLKFITAGESNHGGDYEWIFNKSLEAVINLKFPQIETFIGNKFVEHYEIGEHCFIVCHGKDAEDLKHGLPLTLNEKVELYFKRYVDYNKITSKFIHVIKGDLHTSSSQWGDFFRYKNVLSMYGSSKWVQTNFMTNTRGISMDILNNNSVTEHQLFL